MYVCTTSQQHKLECAYLTYLMKMYTHKNISQFSEQQDSTAWLAQVLSNKPVNTVIMFSHSNINWQINPAVILQIILIFHMVQFNAILLAFPIYLGISEERKKKEKKDSKCVKWTAMAISDSLLELVGWWGNGWEKLLNDV